MTVLTSDHYYIEDVTKKMKISWKYAQKKLIHLNCERYYDALMIPIIRNEVKNNTFRKKNRKTIKAR